MRLVQRKAFKLSEVSDMLGVTVQCLRLAAVAGKLPGAFQIRERGAWWVKAEALPEIQKSKATA